MIGKLLTALAGRTVARTMGGASAGPAGAIIGAALPVVLPRVARALGPVGMVVAAVGGVLFTRWLDRRNAREAALGGVPPRAPEATLGGPSAPRLLEGELAKR